MQRSPALTYVPYQQLGGAPSVIVDGSPAEGTILCLSHWPGIASPPQFAADLSTEMAFRYLDTYDLHDSATAVSNNHFDQDGLISIYTLAFPEAALARQPLLIDIAHGGDFARFHLREAARISMVISAYATPGRSPVGGLATNYEEMTAQLYRELLGRVDELCDHPERFRQLWEEEDAHLTASEEALATGEALITEVPGLDLAVITVSDAAPSGGGHRFAGEWTTGLHPMAIHNATDCFATLIVRDHSYEFTYGYESWVQYQSRRPRPRVDLAPLVERLNATEKGPGQWITEPISRLSPTLRLQGSTASEIPPERFRAILEDHLQNAPPAWDPYGSAG
jgi:hypothetical protein